MVSWTRSCKYDQENRSIAKIIDMNFYKVINEETKAKNINKPLVEAKGSSYPDFCKGLHYRLAEPGTRGAVALVGTLDPNRTGPCGFTHRRAQKGYVMDSTQYMCFLTKEDAEKMIPNSALHGDAYPYVSKDGYDRLVRIDLDDNIPTYVGEPYIRQRVNEGKPVAKEVLDRFKAAEKVPYENLPENPFISTEPELQEVEKKRKEKEDKKDKALKEIDELIKGQYQSVKVEEDPRYIIYHIPCYEKYIKEISIPIMTSYTTPKIGDGFANMNSKAKVIPNVSKEDNDELIKYEYGTYHERKRLIDFIEKNCKEYDSEVIRTTISKDDRGDFFAFYNPIIWNYNQKAATKKLIEKILELIPYYAKVLNSATEACLKLISDSDLSESK